MWNLPERITVVLWLTVTLLTVLGKNRERYVFGSDGNHLSPCSSNQSTVIMGSFGTRLFVPIYNVPFIMGSFGINLFGGRQWPFLVNMHTGTPTQFHSLQLHWPLNNLPPLQLHSMVIKPDCKFIRITVKFVLFSVFIL